MSYGTSLGLTLPTVGVTAGPTYATMLNSVLTSLINVLESKVTPSGMDISDDLNFLSGATYSAALNLERATFENKAAAISAATYPTSLYLVNGNLYFNDNSGNQIQVTADGAVNVSSAGGVTGSGYGSGSVEVNWDSGSSKYRMRSGAAADSFASIHVNDVLMNDGSGNTLTVAAPAMSADYTLTLPSAVPAATQLLAFAATGAVSAATAVVSGDNVTLASGGHLTVAGSGRFKHGSMQRQIPAIQGTSGSALTHTIHSNGKGVTSSGLNTNAWYVPIELPVGARILAVRGYVDDNATGTTTITMTVRRHEWDATPGTTTLGSATSAGSGADQELSVSSLTETVADDLIYSVDFAASAANSCTIYHVEVDYDFP